MYRSTIVSLSLMLHLTATVTVDPNAFEYAFDHSDSVIQLVQEYFSYAHANWAYASIDTIKFDPVRLHTTDGDIESDFVQTNEFVTAGGFFVAFTSTAVSHEYSSFFTTETATWELGKTLFGYNFSYEMFDLSVGVQQSIRPYTFESNGVMVWDYKESITTSEAMFNLRAFNTDLSALLSSDPLYTFAELILASRFEFFGHSIAPNLHCYNDYELITLDFAHTMKQWGNQLQSKITFFHDSINKNNGLQRVELLYSYLPAHLNMGMFTIELYGKLSFYNDTFVQNTFGNEFGVSIGLHHAPVDGKLQVMYGVNSPDVLVKTRFVGESYSRAYFVVTIG